MDTVTLALRIANAPQGVTLTLDGSPLPSSGYVVGGGVPSFVTSAHLPTAFLIGKLLVWLSYYPEVLEASAVGTWVHEGRLYVDAVDIVPARDEALSLAASREELAIWDLATDTPVFLNPDRRALKGA